jgi:hypothetical protein
MKKLLLFFTLHLVSSTIYSQSVPSDFYKPKVDFPVGSGPFFLAIGDLDGDGKPDIAVANFNDNSLSVLRNTSTIGAIGASSFAAKIDFATGNSPTKVAIGDIDADGKADLVVANYLSNTISVLRNTSTAGNISFAAKVDFATGANPEFPAIGDIDGDGKPDVVVDNVGSNTISVLRNTSTSGSISFATKADFTTGSNPRELAVIDVDGDGKLDVAVANVSSNNISVLRNTSTSGTTTFAAKLDFATGDGPFALVATDADGDGKPDLAVTNAFSSTVSVLRNISTAGSISFAAKTDFATGTGGRGTPQGIAAGDADADGKPDLIVSNASANTISVLRNLSTTGTVSYAANVDFATGTSPLGVALGDIDGDGSPEVAVANNSSNTVSVLQRVVTNTAPVITSNGGGAVADTSIAENIAIVTNVFATDVDAGTTITYNIPAIGGADSSKFVINSTNGELRFKTAPNFDMPTDVGANNVYEVIVVASDGVLGDTQTVRVTITNVNEAPVIVSSGGGSTGNENIPENSTFVVGVLATDQDAGSTITYSISGGVDQSKFTINNTTGGLSFITAPNFEAPTDFGADNIYVVTVRATSGSLSDEQTIAVSIRNVNEAPSITSNGGGDNSSISIPENTTAVTTVTATDPDAGTTMKYSKSGGADSSKFVIDSTSGALRFTTAPDFEAPTDADANNTYIVIVRASDGTNTDEQTLTVAVTNVAETSLPANLVNVKAYQKGTAIQVEWTSLTELNVDRFEVEKSTDGQTFTTLGTIQARGNSTGHVNYSLPDHAAQGGSNYYRIKAIDKNGTAQYSSVVRVNVGSSNRSITVYPNPVTTNTISLQLSNLERGKYTVTLTNKLGQQLYYSVIEHNGGSSTQTLRINSSFPKGSYQLQVIGDDVRMTKQLIKQ